MDENGLAAAWVKRYGGPEGSGFVRFDGWAATPEIDLNVLAALAEHAPVSAAR